jgi:hypothetical protein
VSLLRRRILFSVLVGAWPKCFSAFDKAKEKARWQMRSSLDLLFKLAGNYVTFSEKAGHKSVLSGAHLAHPKRLSQHHLIKCLAPHTPNLVV